MTFTSKADFVQGKDWSPGAAAGGTGGGTGGTTPATTGTQAAQTQQPPAQVPQTDPMPTITDQNADGIPDTALSTQNTGSIVADEPEAPAEEVTVTEIEGLAEGETGTVTITEEG